MSRRARREAQAQPQVAYFVGRYPVHAILGRGSFGTVYLGTHPDTGASVAVKVLDRLAATDPAVHQALRRDLHAEARALASIADEHCVRVFDVVDQEGVAALVTEHVDGASLRAVLKHHGRLEPRQALRVLRGALQGLVAVHRAGIVHGDLKPDNVLLDRSGVSHLIDFGLAAPPTTHPAPGSSWSAGTPGYLAPETIATGFTDARSDLYACAVMLFELLCGRRPFEGMPEQVLWQHQHAAVPDPRSLVADVGDELAALCVSGLAKDPGARPASAVDFLRALERAAADRWGPGWPGAVGVAGVAGVGGLVGGVLASAAAPAPLAGAVVAGAGAAGAAGIAGTGAGAVGVGAGGAGVGGGAVAGGTTAAAAVGTKAVIVAAAVAVVATGTTAAVVAADTKPERPRQEAAAPLTPSPSRTARPSPTPEPVVPHHVAVPAKRAIPGCGPRCELLDAIEVEHPTLGVLTLVVAMTDNTTTLNNAVVSGLDASGDEVWRSKPYSVYPGDGSEFATPPSDVTDNLFLSYNPGRYDGTIILRVDGDGYEDLSRTTDDEFGYGGRFYYSRLVGPRADGRYAIEQFANDCVPDCAGGAVTSEIYTWNGRDYVVR